MMNNHPEEEPNFLFKLDKAWVSSLQRQIMEVIRIDDTEQASMMNSRAE